MVRRVTRKTGRDGQAQFQASAGEIEGENTLSWKLRRSSHRPDQTPSLPHPRDVIEIPPIPEPHLGTSYNPPVGAYQELLLKAHEIEEQRLKESTKMADVKKTMDQLWSAEQSHTSKDVAPGMLVDPVQSETDEDDVGGESGYQTRNRLPERKTKQQRRKAANLLAEVILASSCCCCFSIAILTTVPETCTRRDSGKKAIAIQSRFRAEPSTRGVSSHRQQGAISGRTPACPAGKIQARTGRTTNREAQGACGRD